jgi:hypothetical protein
MLKCKHTYLNEQKRQWFGDGEWVTEPDFAEFEHSGYQCKIVRMIILENSSEAFGGHLCGYVIIPPGHPWYGKRMDEIDCECHGGLTFAGEHPDVAEKNYLVGFDCAHAFDIVPSMKSYQELKLSLFNLTYKNFDYCVEQCKKIAEQAKADHSCSIEVYCAYCQGHIVHQCNGQPLRIENKS